MGEHQRASGDEGVGELAGDVLQPFPFKVEEELAADDEVESAGQRIVRDIELRELNVGEPCAAGASSRERDFRHVGGNELTDPRREPNREVAFCASDFERPWHVRREQRQGLLVLTLLVGRLVAPGIWLGCEPLLEMAPTVCHHSWGLRRRARRMSLGSDGCGRAEEPGGVQDRCVVGSGALDERLTGQCSELTDLRQGDGGKQCPSRAARAERRSRVPAERRPLRTGGAVIVLEPPARLAETLTQARPVELAAHNALANSDAAELPALPRW